MRRLYCEGLILLFATHIAWSSNPLYVSQDLIDVGEIWEGELVTLHLQIGNKSENPIALGKTKSGCSCVATDLSAETIMPGGKIDLDVKLLRERPGRFNEFVVVQGRSGPDQSVPFIQRIAIEGETQPTYNVEGMWQGADQQVPQTLVPFVRTDSCKLPRWRISEPCKLMVHVSGVRPDDPVAQTASVTVDSAYFKLSDHEHRTDAAGKLDCTLFLVPKKQWDQGVYYDRLTIKLGPDFKLSRNIAFRLIGPIWSEKATVNFGRVRPKDPSPRKVLLHFPSLATVWSDIDVMKTEPTGFGRAVTVAGVKAKGKDVEVTLVPDPAGLSDTDGFFNFQLYLGNKVTPSQGESAEEKPMLKLRVYGIAMSIDKG